MFKSKYIFIMIIVAFTVVVIDSGLRSVVTSPFILFDAKNSTHSSQQILTGHAGIQGDYLLEIGDTRSTDELPSAKVILGETTYNYYNLDDPREISLDTEMIQLDVVTRKGIIASFNEETEIILENSNLLFNRYHVKVREGNSGLLLDLHTEFSISWIAFILLAGAIFPAMYLLLINIAYARLNSNSSFSLFELFMRFLVPYLLAFLMPILLNYYFVFGLALLLTNSYFLGLLFSIVIPAVISLLLVIRADIYYQKRYSGNFNRKEESVDKEVAFFTKREKVGNFLIMGFLFVDVYVTKYVLPIQIQSLIFYDPFWFFIWILTLFVLIFIGFHYIQYFTGNYRKANENEIIQAGIRDVEKKIQSPVHLMVKKDTRNDYNAWVYAMKSLMGNRPHIYVTEGIFMKFNTREITSIIYHEIGHIKLHHTRYVLLLSSVTVLLTGTTIFLGRQISLAAGWYQYLLILIIVVLLGFFIQQLIPNFVSKMLEHKADAYAVRLMEGKSVYINALNKITELHDDGLEPRLRREWRESHPSLKKRIDYLNKIQ